MSKTPEDIFEFVFIIIALLIYILSAILRSKRVKKFDSDKFEGEATAPNDFTEEEEAEAPALQERTKPTIKDIFMPELIAEDELELNNRINEAFSIETEARLNLKQAEILNLRASSNSITAPLSKIIIEAIINPLKEEIKIARLVRQNPESHAADYLFRIGGFSTIYEKSFLINVISEILTNVEANENLPSFKAQVSIAQDYMKIFNKYIGYTLGENFKFSPFPFLHESQPGGYYYDERVIKSGIVFYPLLPEEKGNCQLLFLIPVHITKNILSSLSLPQHSIPSIADYICTCLLGKSYLLATVMLSGEEVSTQRLDCIDAALLEMGVVVEENQLKKLSKLYPLFHHPRQSLDAIRKEIASTKIGPLELKTLATLHPSESESQGIKKLIEMFASDRFNKTIYSHSPVCVARAAVEAAFMNPSLEKRIYKQLITVLAGKPLPMAKMRMVEEPRKPSAEPAGAFIVDESLIINSIILASIFSYETKKHIPKI